MAWSPGLYTFTSSVVLASFVVISMAVTSLKGVCICLKDVVGSSLLLTYIAVLGGVSDCLVVSIRVHDGCVGDDFVYLE